MREKDITIRPWREGDDVGLWKVLEDASYSNIAPTFRLCMHKPVLRAISIFLIGFGLLNGLPTIALIPGLLGAIGFVYLLAALSSVMYLYGSTLNDVKDIRESYFSHPDHHFWVAECDGEIAGTIAIVRKRAALDGCPDRDGPLSSLAGSSSKVAWLRRMAVKKKFRGRGIAKGLVMATLEFCRRRQYDCVFLITTEVHHAARSLYSYMGFQLVATQYYRYVKGLVKIKTFEYEYLL